MLHLSRQNRTEKNTEKGKQKSACRAYVMFAVDSLLWCWYSVVCFIIIFRVQARENDTTIFRTHSLGSYFIFFLFFPKFSTNSLNDNCLMTVNSNTNTHAKHTNTYLETYKHTLTHARTHSSKTYHEFHWQLIVGTLNFPNRKCAEKLHSRAIFKSIQTLIAILRN